MCLDHVYLDWADSCDSDVSDQGCQAPAFISALTVKVAAAAVKAAPSTLTWLTAMPEHRSARLRRHS